MRVLGLRTVAVARVRVGHRTRHTTAETELCAIGPLLDLGRGHMVPPAAPVVPRDEDRNLRPESRRDDGLHLARGPLVASGDVARTSGTLGRRVGGMLAQRLVGIEP